MCCLTRRLPAQSRRAPPRYSWPRSRLLTGAAAGSATETAWLSRESPCHLPARRAPLARKRGTDLLHPAGCLVLQPAHQQPPPRPQDLPVQPGLGDIPARILPRSLRGPRHVLDTQVSTRIRSNLARDVRGDLLRPVLAPVRLAGRIRAIACFTCLRRFEPRRSAGEFALQPPQPDPLPPGQGRAMQQLAGGQGRGDRHPSRRPPPGRYPVREPAQGSPRRRYATGPRGPSSPGRTSPLAARRGTSGTVPTRPSGPRPGQPSGKQGARPTGCRAAL